MDILLCLASAAAGFCISCLQLRIWTLFGAPGPEGGKPLVLGNSKLWSQAIVLNRGFDNEAFLMSRVSWLRFVKHKPDTCSVRLAV